MPLFLNGSNGKPEFSSSFRINYQRVIYVNKREKYIRLSFSRSFRSEWLSSMIYMAEKDIVSAILGYLKSVPDCFAWKEHVNYDLWKQQGFLQTTEGNVVHYGFIESFIEQLGLKYNIREIAFDRWGAVQMTQNLDNLGFTVVPFGQGFKDMFYQPRLTQLVAKHHPTARHRPPMDQVSGDIQAAIPTNFDLNTSVNANAKIGRASCRERV